MPSAFGLISYIALLSIISCSYCKVFSALVYGNESLYIAVCRCGCVGTGSVMELEEVAVTRSVACGFVFREATSAIMKECTAMACGTNGVEVGSEAQVAIEGTPFLHLVTLLSCCCASRKSTSCASYT